MVGSAPHVSLSHETLTDNLVKSVASAFLPSFAATFVQSGEKVTHTPPPLAPRPPSFSTRDDDETIRSDQSSHAPDCDAHILHVGADGRDVALHLAGPLAGAAGGPHIAELAQLL